METAILFVLLALHPRWTLHSSADCYKVMASASVLNNLLGAVAVTWQVWRFVRTRKSQPEQEAADPDGKG